MVNKSLREERRVTFVHSTLRDKRVGPAIGVQRGVSTSLAYINFTIPYRKSNEMTKDGSEQFRCPFYRFRCP